MTTITRFEAQYLLDYIDRTKDDYEDLFKTGVRAGYYPLTTSFYFKNGIKKLKEIAGYDQETT